MPNQIPVIRLSEDKQLDLVRKLDNMRLAAIDYKGSWDTLHAEYLKMYLCLPEQEVRTFPWYRANNFFAPVIRSHVDSFSAQVFDAMFSTMPRVIGIEGSDIADAELLTLYYFDFLWNSSVLNLKRIANDWNFDTNLDGTGIVKNRWSKDKFLQRQQEMKERLVTESLGEEFLGQPLTTQRVEMDFVEAARIKRVNLPIVETAPVSRIFPAPGSGPSMQYPDCPWFFEETLHTEMELRSMSRMGFAGMDELIETLEESTPTEQEREIEDYEELGSRHLRKASVLTFYMRLALPGQIELLDDNEKKRQQFDGDDAYAEEVIITYLPGLQEENRISKIVPLARVRSDNKRPYIDNRFNRLPRSWFGQGLAAKLRKIQTQTNVAFRQLADFGTLRNMPTGFYDPGVTGLIKDNPMRPGHFTPVRGGGSGITMPTYSGSHDFQVSWLQQLNRYAELDTNITDATQGRSESGPNPQRTARGLQTLVQQSNIAFSHKVALYAEAFNELFQQVHELHKFNAPSELIFKVTGKNGFEQQRLTRSVFQQDIDFQFELNPNRMQDQQNNFQLAQMFQQYGPLMIQFPPAVLFFKKVYESFGNKDFDTVEKAIQEFRQIQMQQQQAAQAAQGAPPGAPPQAPPMGGPMGPPPMGGLQPPTEVEPGVEQLPELSEEDEMVAL